MEILIDRFLKKTIDKFSSDKEVSLKSGKKYSASYGKWDDKWNIDKVLMNCTNLYLIDRFIRSNEAE